MSSRPARPEKSENRSRSVLLLVSATLVLSTLVVYSSVLDNPFLIYDDPEYVVDNPPVAEGITLEGVKWAFTHSHSGNWHPLTWISHMIDCEFFGLDPGFHHGVNVVLHGLSAALLFLALQMMTRNFWPSVFVAALFAVHPLRVESVAWIAERKDVLSGLLWMLAILAYARYAKRPCFRTYVWVPLWMAMGLMAKPILVILPVVLLLLDVWPLGRTRLAPSGTVSVGAARLILEKVPLFVLALASGVVTLISQGGGRAIVTLETIPAGWRVANAFVSYGWYALRTVWPVNLAVFYPHPALLPSSSLWSTAVPAVVAALVLTAALFVSLRRIDRWPWLTTGWLWYLTTLLPVIGLIQVGSQARADRYAYLSTVGLYIVIAWGGHELIGRRPRVRLALISAAALVLVISTVLARQQVAYWRDDRSLFERALAVTDDNFVAHNNLGAVADKHGDLKNAARHYEEAVRLQPNRAVFLGNLGGVRAKQGRFNDAGALFEKAIRIEPDDANLQTNLGSLLLTRGEIDRAVEHLEHAVRMEPRHYRAHCNLGAALTMKGELPRATLHLERALELKPDYAAGHLNMGQVASARGDDRRAVAHLRQAIDLDSRLLQARTALAWILATSQDAAVRDGREALRQAGEVAGSKSPDSRVLELLAAAHAEMGEFDRAVEWQLRALDVSAHEQRDPLRRQLEEYRAGRPRRDRPAR